MTESARSEGGNRVISCPNCQAENEAGAKTCHACGKELPVAAPSGALPPWLQALKPDHLKEAEQEAQAEEPAREPAAVDSLPPATMQAESEPAPVAIAAEVDTPVAVPVSAQQENRGGTDTVVATQPTPAVRPVAPAPAGTGDAGRAKGSPKTSGAASNETASLINEDDLPGWLRAFSENDTSSKAASIDDQSWMLGTSDEATAGTVAENLAQSWQAPTRATARAGAAVFATPAESGAKVTKVAKPERVIVAPVSVAAAESAPAAPIPITKVPATGPSRLGTNTARPGAIGPVPVQPARTGVSIQRIAVIAFLVALVIFLIVVGIFVVVPALTK
jgi:hypothetical protein